MFHFFVYFFIKKRKIFMRFSWLYKSIFSRREYISSEIFSQWLCNICYMPQNFFHQMFLEMVFITQSLTYITYTQNIDTCFFVICSHQCFSATSRYLPINSFSIISIRVFSIMMKLLSSTSKMRTKISHQKRSKSFFWENLWI